MHAFGKAQHADSTQKASQFDWDLNRAPPCGASHLLSVWPSHHVLTLIWLFAEVSWLHQPSNILYISTIYLKGYLALLPQSKNRHVLAASMCECDVCMMMCASAYSTCPIIEKQLFQDIFPGKTTLPAALRAILSGVEADWCWELTLV